MFSCTGGWKTKLHSQTCFQLGNWMHSWQDLSLEPSEVGKEAGHKTTICAGVNCSGDGRVLEPAALKGAS